MYYTHDEIIENMKAQAGQNFQPRTGVGRSAQAVQQAVESSGYTPPPAPLGSTTAAGGHGFSSSSFGKTCTCSFWREVFFLGCNCGAKR